MIRLRAWICFCKFAPYALFATMIVAALAVGRPLSRLLKLDDDDALSGFAWSAGLGLLAWGCLLALLGLCNGLYSPFIRGLTATSAIVGIVQLWRGGYGKPDRQLNVRARWHRFLTGLRNQSPLTLFFAVAAGVAAGASFLSALAPPIAGDALCYHLELPKRYLQMHGLVHIAESDNSTYPLLAEMWFLWGLAVDGPIAAQLIHWFCGLVAAAAAFTIALPIVGRSTATIAACLVLITPGLNNQMTAPLNDVALAMFAGLALAAGWRAVVRRDNRYAVAAGLFLGERSV
ncbi:MAG: hypothetical protein QM775_07100 [Pirellulales bacterium]